MNRRTNSSYGIEYLEYQKNVKQIRSFARSRACVGHFTRFFGDKILSEITASDIDIYKQRRLSEGVKQNTIARELGVE